MSELLLSDRIKGTFWGFICGDAIGLPVKNQPREHRKIYPLENMTGWGTYNLPPGNWSDETSILLNTTESFISSNVSENSFFEGLKKWYYEEQWNSAESILEIAEATRLGVENYASDMSKPISTMNEQVENGSDLSGIIIPITLFNLSNLDIKKIPEIYQKLTSSIYRTPIATMGLTLIHVTLLGILKGVPLKRLLYGIKQYFNQHFSVKPYKIYQKDFQFLLNGEYNNHESLVSNQSIANVLECSIWALLNSSCYEDAVLNAVNLGEQSDTISALTGCFAGAYYGYNQIPEEWLSYIPNKKEISKLVQNFLKAMTEKK